MLQQILQELLFEQEIDTKTHLHYLHCLLFVLLEENETGGIFFDCNLELIRAGGNLGAHPFCDEQM